MVDIDSKIKIFDDNKINANLSAIVIKYDEYYVIFIPSLKLTSRIRVKDVKENINIITERISYLLNAFFKFYNKKEKLTKELERKKWKLLK